MQIQPITCYIALGSNLNHPVTQLKTAICSLQQLPNTRFICVSQFYQTAPVGMKNQPDFMNAVACIETTLSAQALFLMLQKIENAQGRRRQEKNGPRTLDLDLLLYGQKIAVEPDLIIPHPRLEERTFVLVPLLEIAPELILPNRKSVKNCLLSLEM